MDILKDFNEEVAHTLKFLAEKHSFLIFEDRKLVDIGNTVQMQYYGGTLRISEWAHIVNISILPGPGIVNALSQTINSPEFPHRGDRGFLLLAEVTSKGRFATCPYPEKCVELGSEFPEAVLGFIATHYLTEMLPDGAADDEDFLTFTTGINMASEGNKLGQQYQTPEEAVNRGADFIIAGRGVCASVNPVEAAKQYQKARMGGISGVS